MYCVFVCCGFVLLVSVFFYPQLVLLTFYSHVLVHATYFWVVEILNVNKACFVSVMGIMVTCTETVVNAAGFTVPIYVCSCTTV